MGICVFGAGDCGSSTTINVTMDDTSISRDIAKVITNQAIKNVASGTAVNTWVWNMKDTVIKGDLIVTDIAMDAQVTVDFASFGKITNDAEFFAKLEESLKKNLTVKTTATSDLFQTASARAEANTNIRNTAINEVMRDIKVDQLNECISSALARNDVEWNWERSTIGGDVVISGLEFNAKATLSAKCVTDSMNKTLSEFFRTRTVEEIADLSAQAEGKGVTSLVDSVFKGAKGLLDSVFGGLSGPIKWIVIAVVLIAVVAIISGVACFMIPACSEAVFKAVDKGKGLTPQGNAAEMANNLFKGTKGGGTKYGAWR